jgi:ribosomal protein L16 Arg81 hydroxylase
MSKVKQYAEDTAEQKVDSIISQLKDGQIDLDTAKVNILNTENKQMLGINSENVDEIINMELASANVSKSELKKNAHKLGSMTIKELEEYIEEIIEKRENLSELINDITEIINSKKEKADEGNFAEGR